MFFSSLNIIFNISNSLSSISINIQPRIFLPKFDLNNKKIIDPNSITSHYGVNKFSIEF